LTKSSPSIWRYVVSVKSTVKISSIFVSFLQNMNFTNTYMDFLLFAQSKPVRKWGKKCSNWSEVHLYHSNFLQNPYFRDPQIHSENTYIRGTYDPISLMSTLLKLTHIRRVLWPLEKAWMSAVRARDFF
jgi:hypothetical protein